MGHRSRLGIRSRVCVAVASMCCLGVSAAPALATSSPPALAGTPLSNQTDLAGVTALAVESPSGGHTYAYATAASPGQLTAIDVSNPTSLVDAGTSAPQTSLKAGSNIALANGLAYVVSKNRNASATNNDDGSGNALTIMDVSSVPATPQLVGSVHDTTALFGAYGIAVQGNYAFVAAQGLIKGQPQTPLTGTGAFTVVDVSTPSNPTIVASISNSFLPGPWAGTNALQHATSVAISGNYAYVTGSYDDRLTVIDITDPTHPAIVASVKDPTKLNFDVDVTIQGHYAYVADQSTAGMAIVDISNPLNPQITGVSNSSWLNGGYRIRVRGNFAYVSAFYADAVSAVDISDPTNPRVAGGNYEPMYLFSTTGLDLDPTSGYLIATSPDNPPTHSPPLGTVSAYALDPAPNAVTIQSASEPPKSTTQTTAGFTFATADQAVTTRCSLDGAPPGLCTTPGTQNYAGLGPGTHTFTVQAIDTTGTPATASYTWTVLGPPANTSPPSISGSILVGHTLSSSTGAWAGTAPISYAYQWQRCAQACSDIGGATRSSYTLDSADQGANVRVVVTASNSLGSAAAVATPVGPVAAATTTSTPATPTAIPAAPTLAQIRTLLTRSIVALGKEARIGALLKHGGFSFSFTAPSAGRLVIAWYLVRKGAHHAAAKPVLVAVGVATFTRARAGKMTIKLTASGKRRLKHANRLTLTAKATFAPTGKAATRATKAFTLKR